MSSKVFRLSTTFTSQLDLGMRSPPPKTKILDERFWDGYDTSTLCYDCFWQSAQRRVRLICPKFFNFEGPLKKAIFRCDGIQVRPKLRKFDRFDVIDLSVGQQPGTVTISIAQNTVSLPVHADSTERYSGKFVLYTMLKDEPLEWVCDWIKAHQRNHRADAVLISNNNSTIYTSDELAAAIKTVKGIDVADVIDVPLPYAPRVRSITKLGRTSFLQTACLNLVRDRFLTRAGAVLQCDVDELVVSPDDQSIFDATFASRLKFVTFNGTWVYPQKTNRDQRHSDHVNFPSEIATCPPKYCIVPDSALGRMCWSVHGLEKLSRHWFRPRSPFWFLHCSAISTSWKHKRNQLPEDGLIPDDRTKDFMRKTFIENFRPE